MRRGKPKVQFANVDGSVTPHLQAVGITLLPELFELRVVIGDESLRWSLPGSPRPELVLQLQAALSELVEQGQVTSVATLKGYRRDLRSFLDELAALDPRCTVRRLVDIDRNLLEGLDPPSIRSGQWKRLSKIVKVLRFVRKRRPEMINPGLSSDPRGDRLRYVSRHGKPKPTPKDPYTPFVTAQLKSAAEQQIRSAVERLSGRPGERRRGESRPQNIMRAELWDRALANGRVDFDEYTAGRKTANLRYYVRAAAAPLSADHLERATTLLAAGTTTAATAKALGLAHHKIERAKARSSLFAKRLRQKREEYLSDTRDLIQEGSNLAADGSRLMAKIYALERFLITEDRRIIQHLGKFSQAHFLRWTDNELGLAGTSLQRASGEQIAWAQRLIRATGYHAHCALGEDECDYNTGLRETSASLFPSPLDLAALLIAIGLRTQLDYTSLKGLSRDCLRSPAAGAVDLFYIKRRAANAKLADRVPDEFEVSHEDLDRVRDGGYDTAGGLVRIALRLTALAREILTKNAAPDAEKLWIYCDPEGTLRRFRFNHAVFRKFCEEYAILDDAGRRLDSIQPSRFRKTAKATIYTKSKGDLRSLTDDHSLPVARDNYANLPSLEEHHDDALTNGFKRALADVAPRVIAPEQPLEAAARELASATGQPLEKCIRVLKGEEDVWIAGCMSFSDGPHSEPGEACTTPYSACLRCDNAVFTSRKLPAILGLRDAIIDQRNILSDDAWNRAHSVDLMIIEDLILPRFDSAEIAAAASRPGENGDILRFLLPLAGGMS